MHDKDDANKMYSALRALKIRDGDVIVEKDGAKIMNDRCKISEISDRFEKKFKSSDHAQTTKQFISAP